MGSPLFLRFRVSRADSKNSNPKFTRERQIFHYTFLFDAYGLPILFDIDDMLKVFRELESKKGRNAKRKFDKFKNQAIYESDLVGNTTRVKEIISKIMDM